MNQPLDEKSDGPVGIKNEIGGMSNNPYFFNSGIYTYLRMPELSRVLVEASAVGVLTIICILLSSFILHKAGYPTTYNPECTDWNKYHIMETTAFLAGFMFHLGAQYSGLNDYYVQNYVA